jgi:Cellulose binding domain
LPGALAVLTAGVINSWPGGYQPELTIANNGTAPAAGWTAGFWFGSPAGTIASSWGATVSQSGATVSAANASYDGAIPAGGSVTWGMIVNGSSQAPAGLSCALSRKCARPLSEGA